MSPVRLRSEENSVRAATLIIKNRNLQLCNYTCYVLKDWFFTEEDISVQEGETTEEKCILRSFIISAPHEILYGCWN
jgi:hypothetical protein